LAKTDVIHSLLSSRSAAELDELFERKIKPWRFHKTETATQRLVKQQGAEQPEE
jgi:hypothetical protein